MEIDFYFLIEKARNSIILMTLTIRSTKVISSLSWTLFP